MKNFKMKEDKFPSSYCINMIKKCEKVKQLISGIRHKKGHQNYINSSSVNREINSLFLVYCLKIGRTPWILNKQKLLSSGHPNYSLVRCHTVSVCMKYLWGQLSLPVHRLSFGAVTLTQRYTKWFPPQILMVGKGGRLCTTPSLTH